MTGAHEQPDNKLLDILNMEFHEKPELLTHIAELLANGIVRCKNVLIKILTVEAYSRHASVDIHNESQVLESTLPVQGRLFCGTVSAADGKGLKQKMFIVSKTMNALCTCSVTLGATPQVSIGPGHASKLNPRDCQLFLASAAVAKFKEMVAPENDLLLTRTPSMSHLRQLTTYFHHPSTFNCWRRTFEPFNDILHMPASIFTLCDLPKNANELIKAIESIKSFSCRTLRNTLYKHGYQCDYDPIAEYDTGIVENLVQHFLDLIESPNNPLNSKSLERTAAVHTSIIIIDRLFLSVNDIIELGWLEREYYATHKTKWDGVLLKVDDHKISPGFVEFSGGANNNTTITKERRDFVNELLTIMDEDEPLKGSYLVTDSASIHKSKPMIQKIEARGYRVMYLPPPPYSPELNPIEQFWALVKGKMKRHRLMKEETLSSITGDAYPSITCDPADVMADYFQGIFAGQLTDFQLPLYFLLTHYKKPHRNELTDSRRICFHKDRENVS
ncbi:hypothetical protein G6F37_010678 [Rhizopus arrhizus]|nr:hypothetical protein G6F38_009117 [Rhizopus arrhizus]KAG1153080.1 hypothetical protein G6F37_010678 [Rhizopus arrhizus]